MLSQKDIDGFEELKQEALRILPKRSILPVVDQCLYLDKDGSWSARFMMSGYSLGKPSLRELLKSYVFAVSGIEPTDEQIEDRESLVLEKMTESLRLAINELK